MAKVHPLKALVVACCPCCDHEAVLWTTDHVDVSGAAQVDAHPDDYWICDGCGRVFMFALRKCRSRGHEILGVRAASPQEIAELPADLRTEVQTAQRGVLERRGRLQGPN